MILFSIIVIGICGGLSILSICDLMKELGTNDGGLIIVAICSVITFAAAYTTVIAYLPNYDGINSYGVEYKSDYSVVIPRDTIYMPLDSVAQDIKSGEK